MEHQIPGALERIENPILIILLVVLMLAVVALWLRDSERQKIMFAMLSENIGAVKDTGAELRRINERFGRISRALEQARERRAEITVVVDDIDDGAFGNVSHKGLQHGVDQG